MSPSLAQFRSASCAIIMLGALGCASQKTLPAVAPSSSQANYAGSYPARLQTTSNAYVTTERDTRRLTTDFVTYPGQLKDPPWPLVQSIVSRADEAGRSASYVEGRRDSESTETFFASENNEITRRVAGSAQYVIKKKECDVDVAGTVSGSLKDAVDKQLEKRLRARNDAHVTIERYRDTLGKVNASALEKQADDISSASYLANIRAIELQRETLELLEEASTVKHTLQQLVAEERAFQAEPNRSAAERKASSDRIAKMSDAEVRIDATVPELQALSKDMDARSDAMRREYATALDNLRKAIASKASGH